jgi:hypothetical protein
MIKRHIDKCRRTVTKHALLRFAASAAVLLIVTFTTACARPPEGNSSSAGDSQKLPFDRQPRRDGISPSQTWVPSATKLPEGTTIVVRLQSTLSSASSRPGDSFTATIDEPVEIEGRTALARGVTATGRVLESRNSSSNFSTGTFSNSGGSLEPGYLRIVLEKLNIGDRPILIETSSIFAKGGPPREEPNSSGGSQSPGAHEDIIFETGRRLNFRLAQAVDLQDPDLKVVTPQNPGTH